MGVMSTDEQLVRSAQAGDAASLGLILVRRRPALFACALAMLGSRERAEDVVQDACVVALRRLPELRDPGAAGGWLLAITRNLCRMQLRSSGRELLVAAPVERTGDSIDEELDRHALRAWVWGAIEALPPEQRLTVALRHFGRPRSYEEIARISGVPVGTVRSRLNAARRALAERLLEAAAPDEAHAARTEDWRARLDAALRGLNAGDPAPARELFAPDAVIRARGQIGGVGWVVPALLDDSRAGVRVRVADVTAGSDLLVLDGDIRNPPGDPEHCPPAFTWVACHQAGRIPRLRFFHPSRDADRRQRDPAVR